MPPCSEPEILEQIQVQNLTRYPDCEDIAMSEFNKKMPDICILMTLWPDRLRCFPEQPYRCAGQPVRQNRPLKKPAQKNPKYAVISSLQPGVKPVEENECSFISVYEIKCLRRNRKYDWGQLVGSSAMTLSLSCLIQSQ
ncbi:unnamed protein product [Natator depressus]